MSISSGQQPRYSAPRGSHKHTCPKCSGLVYRIPRRFIDRCLSLFVHVYRYRCLSADCGWEGNLPRTSVGGKPSTSPRGVDPSHAA